MEGLVQINGKIFTKRNLKAVKVEKIFFDRIMAHLYSKNLFVKIKEAFMNVKIVIF